MPNLVVNYRKTLFEGTAPESLESFADQCQRALVEAFNSTNHDTLEPSAGLVRFVPYGPLDRGTPDICFVIKSGRDGLTKGQQHLFCDTFFDIVQSALLTYVAEASGTTVVDVELFNLASHGLRQTGSTLDFSW